MEPPHDHRERVGHRTGQRAKAEAEAALYPPRLQAARAARRRAGGRRRVGWPLADRLLRGLLRGGDLLHQRRCLRASVQGRTAIEAPYESRCRAPVQPRQADAAAPEDRVAGPHMRPGETAPQDGNAQVVEMLRLWLAEAEKGNIGYLIIAAAEYPNDMSFDACGITDLERLAVEAMEKCFEKIKENKLNRTLPPRENTSADHFVYNCTDSPMGWDFLISLVTAEMTRSREGAPAPLKVRFWFGRDGDFGLRGREQMFFNVFKPLLPLIGAVEETEDILGRDPRIFTLQDIVAAARAGEQVPMLQPSELARQTVKAWFPDGARRPIVITLREADHWPHRNSNIEAWVRFARDLQMQGERVVFVRDTAKTMEALYGFTLCPAASVNVDVRMALYERARCNLLVSNGPCGLCFFSDVPYLYFLEISEDDPHPPNRPGFWPKRNGIPEGGQLPWSKPWQRFIWQSDTYENLSAAWETFQPLLRKAA